MLEWFCVQVKSRIGLIDFFQSHSVCLRNRKQGLFGQNGMGIIDYARILVLDLFLGYAYRGGDILLLGKGSKAGTQQQKR